MRIFLSTLVIIHCLGRVISADSSFSGQRNVRRTLINRPINYRQGRGDEQDFMDFNDSWSQFQVSNETSDRFINNAGSRSRRHVVNRKSRHQLDEGIARGDRCKRLENWSNLESSSSKRRRSDKKLSRRNVVARSHRKIKSSDEDSDSGDDQTEELDSVEWGEWGDWARCSVTCGDGRRVRWRHCTSGNCPKKGLKIAQMKPCHRGECPKGILTWLGIKPQSQLQ